MKKVFIYVRVSTQEQANEGYSVGEQTERLKNYCEAMGWIVAKVFTDAGYSGATVDRPALNEMLREVKLGKADTVLVYKLDRLSRSQKDTLMLIEDTFLKYNTDFASLNEKFDTATPFGRAMIGILAVFAQLEREQIKERMLMGHEARVKKGLYKGSYLSPIGYKYENGELKTIEFEKMQIQKIFEMYSKGVSPYKIADILNNAGMKHQHGEWNSKRIRKLLTKKTYCGYVHFKNEWYKGTHEAFISEELYELCNKIKKQKLDDLIQNNRHGWKVSSYFGGYLYCACCNARFVKKNQSKNLKSGRKIYNYYLCNSRVKKHVEACDNKLWKMEEIDQLIFDEINKLAVDPEYINQIQRPEIDNERPLILNQEIAKLESQMSKLMDLYALGTIDIDMLQSKINDMNKQKEQLSIELFNITEAYTNTLSKESVLEVAQSFGEVLKQGDFDEIRLLIETLIDKVIVAHDSITIHWKFA